MNEQIETLAKVAGYDMINKAAMRVLGFDKEKFAELIIAECCLKLLSMDEKTKGNHNYYKHAALEVKKHFGVKE